MRALPLLLACAAVAACSDYGFTPETAQAAGYDVIQGRAGLLSFAETFDASPFRPTVGLFRERGHIPYVAARTEIHPSLPEMSAAALAALEHAGEPWFLLVEGARIDHAGHDNLLEEMLRETIELSETVELLRERLEALDDFLLFVTADHETGGLTVLEGNGPGLLPEAAFTTGDHTGVDVSWYAIGDGADEIPTHIENTDVRAILLGDAAAQERAEAP
jgi:alkaline phosphatase